MKRMKPFEYKKVAEKWVQTIEDRLPNYGEWSLHKILDEIERLLRQRRRDRKTGPKSARPSMPPKLSRRKSRLSSTGGMTELRSCY